MSSDRVDFAPPRAVYLALGGISLAALLFEVVLTRLFSVIFWYHLAFAAVTIALAGFAVSGLVVHHRRARLEALIDGGWLGRLCVLFAASVVGATALSTVAGSAGAVGVGALVVMAALPFFCAGACVGAALTRWPAFTGGLYGADLAGAAAGGLLAVPALNLLDGPSAALAAAVIGASAGIFFTPEGDRRLVYGGIIATAAILGLQIAAQPLSVRCPKGACEEGLQAEGWNHFSRVAVFEVQPGARAGLSPNYRGRAPATRPMNIDAAAATPIVPFATPAQAAFLRWDLTSLPYRLRPADRVFIAGSGGGPDIVTAHLYGASRIDAAEINPLVVEMAQERFAAFSGRPYSLPGVTPHLDDARSALRATEGSFDVVLMSLVDTFAAATTGAFALTENHLYTLESFQLYLERTAPSGIVATSRWYRPQRPSELLRLVVLARAALESTMWVERAADHILVAAWVAPETPTAQAANTPENSDDHTWGVGLMMMSAEPFTEAERARFRAECEVLGFVPIYAGPEARQGEAADQTQGPAAIAAALNAPELDAFVAAYPANVEPPHDDWPFFFQAGRLFGASRSGEYLPHGLRLLMMLLFGSGAAAAGLIALGWLQKEKGDEALPPDRTPAIVALCVGLGFIVVEVGLIQRFLLLLGHPTWAMVVVLPGLLLGAGAGSAALSRLGEGRDTRAGGFAALGAAAIGLMGAFVLLPIIHAGLGLPHSARLALAGAAVVAFGVVMGMPFPALLQSAERRRRGSAPWLWAINGAASVFGGALAMVLAVLSGYQLTFTVGAAAYVIAAILLLRRTPKAAAQH